MLATADKPRRLNLDDYLSAYDSARVGSAHVDLSEFVPDPEDPHYMEVLGSLIIRDMQNGWADSNPRRMADYQRLFPASLSDRALLERVTREEYRLRLEAGERPTFEEYEQRFGVRTVEWPRPDGQPADFGMRTQVYPLDRNNSPASFACIGHDRQGDLHRAAVSYRQFRLGKSDNLDSWCRSFSGSSDHAELFRDLHESDPQSADRLAEAITTLPDAGTTFLGFRLIQELGKGAFGRVYLARQGDLANRLVALKVSNDTFGESQVLAQLQHTNIVPIYSMHRAGPFQAVCMPYFGATTLKDVLIDLGARESLPNSGKGLVSTLNQRKSATAPGRSAKPGELPSLPSPGRDPEAAPLLSSDGEPQRTENAAITLKMLEGFSYVEAVLWVGARMADGLAHAHEHGILHRDLKPENVLLTEDGQPMLLDFNLSEDTKQRSCTAAGIGGTLPYMAPEHLRAFRDGSRDVDARSDVYGLGIILYELLTAQHPFPTYSDGIAAALPRMIEDRLKPPPDLRSLNPAVSPAVEAIVRHCLEPDPQRRYQTARQLLEDLERHSQDLPLKHVVDPSFRERMGKWARRHPRLTSSTTVGILAGAALLVLGSVAVVRGKHLSRLQAVETLNDFHNDMQTAQFLLYDRMGDPERVERGYDQCQAALSRYHVIDGSRHWEERSEVRNLPDQSRQQLRADVGELLFMSAGAVSAGAGLWPGRAEKDKPLNLALQFNEAAAACFKGDEVPRAVWQQRGELLASLQQNDAAEELFRKASETPLKTGRDRYLAARLHEKAGNYRKALPLLEEATQLDPQSYAAWMVKGYCHDQLRQHPEAVACYSTCIALRPAVQWAWYNRALARLNQFLYAPACKDFDEAIRLAPTESEFYLNRALAREGLRDYQGALADLDKAMELGVTKTRVYFMKATVREKSGDQMGAQRDRDEGMRRRPADELSWVTRGLARAHTDPQAALADYDEALKLNPLSFCAMQNKAHALGELLGKDNEAIQVLDREVFLYPDSVFARAGRGVHLARLGKKEAALADAREALLRDTTPPNLYQVSCIYALTSQGDPKNRLRALELLSLALKGGFGLNLVDKDTDLDPIRKSDEFRKIIEAAKALENRPAKPTP
jgi:serine/threonine protein kinase/tetratricopeptide (TPR) repeat protein